MGEVPYLAGTGGVELGEARTDHEGRRAILLHREGNPQELISLAETMGIEVVEIIFQTGKSDPRTYFGSGRLQDISDDISSAIEGHKWHGVDLAIINTNATPRQLVNIQNKIKIEVWDRVRLLLSLFTSHASSVEARIQVRIARLEADRTLLRELANQETTGERAGFGAGGRQALQNVILTVNRELTQLKRKQNRYANSRRERRRQRSRSGAMTVGLAGYTNAGKSSLFLKLSGKEVLVEDKLFSTLETTIGRMEKSPRVLLADTIGFIDRLPSELLDAFHATLDESLQCDLLLLLVDSSDSISEIIRKLTTSRREVMGRIGDNPTSILIVLTKIDDCNNIDAAINALNEMGTEPLCISSLTGKGIEELKEKILNSLYGSKISIEVHEGKGRSSESIISHLYDCGIVTKREENTLTMWCNKIEIERLINENPQRISTK
ncbi:MAG: GTPase HflX [Candidatus Poseidoniaceae archaeon]|jgi:GTP-binding protein HflX|nr:GTPase HflX [Candidatus Poseidoniaceae archaeon]